MILRLLELCTSSSGLMPRSPPGVHLCLDNQVSKHREANCYVSHQVRIIRCLLNQHLHEITRRDLSLLFLLFLTGSINPLQLFFDRRKGISSERWKIGSRFDFIAFSFLKEGLVRQTHREA